MNSLVLGPYARPFRALGWFRAGVGLFFGGEGGEGGRGVRIRFWVFVFAWSSEFQDWVVVAMSTIVCCG